MYKITRILIHAARTGNVRTAARLINSHGLSYRPEWQHGYKFLKIALKYGKTAFVEFLISKGCCIARKKGKTLKKSPLHFAVRNGNIEIVELLLRQGANANGKNKRGEAPLETAVFEGHLKVVELLLDYGADVNSNASLQNSYTPLHYAFHSEKIAKVLLMRGADVHARTVRQETPLHFAVRLASCDVVRLLLDYGSDVNAEAEYYDYEEPSKLVMTLGTPLHVAVRYALDRDVVKVLLERGANIYYVNQDGKTALFIAVTRGDLPVVEEILKYPNCVCESNETCLEVALCNDGENFEKIVDALIEYGFTVRPESARKPEVLRGAIVKGNQEVVECLLKYGAEVDACLSQIDLLSPLHCAVKNKHEEIAQLLIRCKAEVNATDRKGRPPIFHAVDNVDLRMTQLLLSNGANVRDFPEVFHAAVRRDSVEIAEVLLPHGVDVNVDVFGKTAPHLSIEEYEDSSDCEESFEKRDERIDIIAHKTAKVQHLLTPLHVSIEKGYDSMVYFLLGHNANVNAADKLGLTPLHLSARRGSLDVCKMLLNKGARVNARNGEGGTALHLAVCNIHKEVVKLLVKSEAKVNFKGGEGKTPLHLAVEQGNPGIIVALLKSGSNVNSRCWRSKTPLHYSCARADAKTVKKLLDYGADMRISCEHTYYTPLDAAYQQGQFYRQDGLDGYEYDEEIDIDAFEDTMDLLYRHKVKLETAGYEPWDEMSMPNYLQLPVDFQSDCVLELVEMASEFIDGTNVSYHDILVNDTRFLAKYMNNENIAMVSERGDHRKQFPLYAGVLRGQFQKGLRRIKLLEPAARVFRSFVDLPEECAEKILEYLSESDLKALTRLRRLKSLRA